jgi:hypothetical protein
MKITNVEFPAIGASYYPMQTAIKFPALVDGKPVLCFIEVATLAENYEDFRVAYGLEIFESHRPEIESIAATMIENGYVNADNDLFIRNAEFARFKANAAGNVHIGTRGAWIITERAA